MSATTGVGQLDHTQAEELSEVLDAEAYWENMRKVPGDGAEMGGLLRDLTARQKAYEAFRLKLTAYNATYKPAHIPELMLNNPARLGIWCGKMRTLYRRLENHPKAQCPRHLLEKAYRCADRIGERLKATPIGRALPPKDIAATVQVLETVIKWCAALEPLRATPEGQPVPLAVTEPSHSSAAHEV